MIEAAVQVPMRGAVVLRPEPGSTATATRLAAEGIDVLRQPLFAIAPVAWCAPDPADYDALLLTSANAARHAGAALRSLRSLPVLAVGHATASAAQAAGLSVALTGDADAATLVADGRSRGCRRLLHLTGRDHVALPGVDVIAVYDSRALPLPPGAARAWRGRVALLHSVRAARRFADLVGQDAAVRAAIGVAALSPPVLGAAGTGWARVAAAEHPTDDALVACAAALIDPPGGGVDKHRR